ncbi:flocculation protein FLO11-like [Acipenser oxyrinchus oxyrinchus]|uniref:Flocculation protein FLO11-like n=1 Tax=Acipenser oxyrinchus oxyrinchus TaxID=40147 RepID=A0AAD8DEB2_ACIOX|nr:flocculation protein FLO11-like [Acipenser oxyrinchus oxyrinchus]
MRMGSAFFVNMRCPVTETATGKSTKPAIVCRNTSMMVELPEGSLKPVQVIGKDNRPVDISDAFIKCGYLLVERGGKINLTAVYAACDVKIVNKNYTLMIIYTTASGKREMVQMSCPTRAVQPTAHTTRKPVTTEKSTKPTLPPTAVCKTSSMTVELPSESLQVLLLNLSNEWVDVNAAPSYCNYSLVQGRGGRNFFTTPYRACDVRIQSGNYILKLSYLTPDGRGYLNIRCPIAAGDPTTSSAGDPTTSTSSAGDPTTSTSSAGDPTTRTSSAGDPTTRTSSAGDPTTSSAGDLTGSAPILIFCNSSSIKVELPGGPPEKVKVMGEYFKTNLQDHLCQLGSPKNIPSKRLQDCSLLKWQTSSSQSGSI